MSPESPDEPGQRSPERSESATSVARRREQRGWSFYDWANSAYSATVTSVFFAPYITSIAENAACGMTVSADSPCPTPDSRLNILGLGIAPESYPAVLLVVTTLVQVVLLPITGALADATEHKKRMLGGFAFVGAGATACMFFLMGDRYVLGGVLYFIAQAAFGASMVVYNAYLPEIAEPDERDRLSARGWGLGYLGGGVLLVANVILFNSNDSFGLTESEAIRISLLSAGIWWAGFTLIPLAALRDRPLPPGAPTSALRSLGGALTQLKRTAADVRRHPGTMRFLIAYLIYNDAIQTVIGLAGAYGATELDLAQSDIITAILIVQFVAFGGALLLGRFAATFGAKNVILASLIFWSVVLLGAFSIQRGSATQFLMLAVAIGIVLGGSQALSRSVFSQLIPRGKEAEYFSLYEISERGTSWLGAGLVAVLLNWTGSYRWAIVCLVVFFIAGFMVLRSLDIPKAIREAGNEVPERV